MIDLVALERMTPDALVAWIEARVRNENVDPPVAADRHELPDDFIVAAHQGTVDTGFRGRLELALVEALRRQARQSDLGAPATAVALSHLAGACRRLKLRAAATTLRFLAERGVLGGPVSDLAPATEHTILGALSVLQPPMLLRDHWHQLWSRGPAGFWSIALTGLRRSEPEDALGELALAIRRSRQGQELVLGETLWGFRTDSRCGMARLLAKMRTLAVEDVLACEQALQDVGAEDVDIAAVRALRQVAPGGGALRPWWEPDPALGLPDAPPALKSAA